jgi:hypothetical protein
MKRVPVIDCTDLYHPHQDPGDNFDLLAAYALPEIDLRAVILDTTERYRRGDGWNAEIPRRRDPGFIPVTQLNYLFDRNVPCAVSPFTALRSADDPARDAPAFEQGGIELLLQTLREAVEPVTIMIFCSCRTVAAAFNREPELFREKVAAIHLSAGTSSPDKFDVDLERHRRIPLRPGSPGYREWNVELDPWAFVCLLRSGLPLCLYPCATENGPFDAGRNNSYYDLKSLAFIRDMQPALRNYLHFALAQTCRNDFLLALEDEPDPASLERVCAISRHPVWETALWQMVAGRALVRRADGRHRLIPSDAIQPDDHVLPSGLRSCHLSVDDEGRFSYVPMEKPGGHFIYERGDPAENERPMGEALSSLYVGFRCARGPVRR